MLKSFCKNNVSLFQFNTLSTGRVCFSSYVGWGRCWGIMTRSKNHCGSTKYNKIQKIKLLLTHMVECLHEREKTIDHNKENTHSARVRSAIMDLPVPCLQKIKKNHKRGSRISRRQNILILYPMESFQKTSTRMSAKKIEYILTCDRRFWSANTQMRWARRGWGWLCWKQ